MGLINVGDTTSTDTKARSANYIYTSKVVSGVGETGVLQGYGIYLGASVPANMKIAIYDDDGGDEPDNLVANTASAERDDMSINAWNTFTVSGGATLSAETIYHIGFWANNGYPGPGATSDYDTVASGDAETYNGWPATYGRVFGGADRIGLYYTIETEEEEEYIPKVIMIT